MGRGPSALALFQFKWNTMAITPSTAPVPNQVNPTPGNLPYVQELNYGQMIGEVASWNPNASSSMIERWINHIARKVYDRRMWYGLLTKGQIVTPPIYNTGSCSVTTGSASVQGITGPNGTLWTASLIGRAFRIGFTYPIYQIIGVDPTNQVLTLELQWGGPNISSTGYYIVQQYWSIPNIKYIYAALNLQMMYRMWTNLNQSSLDNLDPSRQRLYYPWAIASMPPDPNGNFQCELYPASTIQQAYPYLAYVQPPNLINDTDSLPSFIRCDIVLAHGIADALMYRPKDNPYYSESTALSIASAKMKEFEAELFQMSQADEALFRQDIIAPFERYPYFQPGGAILAAISPMLAGDAGGIGGGDWGGDF